MIIAWDNKADAALVTAGSQLATRPGSNVQQEHLSEKWETAAGVNSSSLTLDMLSVVSCSVLALLGTNLTSAATLRLRASNADPTAVAGDLLDTGVLSAGVKAGYGAAYKSWSQVTARYWRLDVADASLASLQAGRLFVGPSWTTSVPQLFDWSVTKMDPSRRVRGWAGQTHVDMLPKYRVLAFVLDYMDDTEMYGNAFALAHQAGLANDVLAIPDIAGSYLSEQAVFGLCEASEPLIHRLPRIYRQKFTIEERQ